MLRGWFYLFFTLFSISIYAQNDYKSTSVLATGKWVKFPIEQTGVYKITYTELQKMGFSDPNQVSIYGYGGNILSEDLNSEFHDDLPNIPIYRGTDYILFYALGTITWKYTDKRFTHTNNHYSLSGYYFITDDGKSTSISTTESYPTSEIDFDYFDDYLVYEKELRSVAESGRELYGETFTSSNLNISISLPEGVLSEQSILECNILSKDTSNQTVQIISNDKVITKGAVSRTFYDKKLWGYNHGVETNIHTSQWVPDNSSKFKLQIYYPNISNRSPYLNYVRLNYLRALKNYKQSSLLFRNIESQSKSSQFSIKGANSNSIVWDVSNPMAPIQINGELSGDTYRFLIPAKEYISEFALIQLDEKFSTIQSSDVVKVSNQNLHGISDVDMVIITTPGFIDEAERLRDAHKEVDGLKSVIVTQNEIFNEFSSGTPDASGIRRFMHKLHAENDNFKYLLLFGDGSYDNRFLSYDWKTYNNRQNMLITYQTAASLNHTTHVTDDYFGRVNKTNVNTEIAVIGVGRLPVRTVEQSRNIVDKIIKYIREDNVGNWKNKMAFVADDGSTSDNFSTEHASNTEDIISRLYNAESECMAQKIYLDAYKKDKGSEFPYPGVNKAILKAINDGVFFMNYVGHGSKTAWSDEHVFSMQDIQLLRNEHLPIFATASCDFCPFDNAVNSGGEELLLQKKYGAIALFTTTRVAFSNHNQTFNLRLMSSLFSGNEVRLGDVLREAKRNVSSPARYGLALMGDPAIKIKRPSNQVKVTHIDDELLDNTKSYVFKSMQKVKIKGVVSQSGDVMSNFNGVLYGTMFDNKLRLSTLGNQAAPIPYDDYPNLIFDGTTEVINGEFTFTITIPKDIQYITGSDGKFSLYAYDNTNYSEASGIFTKYSVYGTSDKPVTDTIPPEIKEIYLNDSLFVDKGKVNSTPYFYVRLWDESGINRTESGIGHDITLVIDGEPKNTFDMSYTYNLNDYYSSILGSDKEGEVRFSIPQLSAGMHTAEFKVWDVMNNATVSKFQFEVVTNLTPTLSHVTVYPSPARSQVTFTLHHNRPQSHLKVRFEVYNMSGVLQWANEEVYGSTESSLYTSTWNLRSSSGMRIRPGIYIYRAVISSGTSKEVSEASKFIVL